MRIDKIDILGTIVSERGEMEKVNGKSKLLKKIKIDQELRKQKMELVNQYARYWDLPNFCKRKINEIDSKIEINKLKYKESIKNIY